MINKVTIYRIIRLFSSDYTKRFYLRELAAEIKKPHQTIKPYLETLVERNVLTEIRRRNLVEYALNLKNPLTLHYLTIAEKEIAIETVEKNKNIAEVLSEIRPQSILIAYNLGKKPSLLHIGSHEISEGKLPLLNISSIGMIDTELLRKIFASHAIITGTEDVLRHFIENRNELE